MTINKYDDKEDENQVIWPEVAYTKAPSLDLLGHKVFQRELPRLLSEKKKESEFDWLVIYGLNSWFVAEIPKKAVAELDKPIKNN
jgi:hypothetical protein